MNIFLLAIFVLHYCIAAMDYKLMVFQSLLASQDDKGSEDLQCNIRGEY